jgi:glycerol-3-phosphate dehydrogenase
VAPAPAQDGEDFGHGLFAREVDWMIAQEWATCAADILWRRTKLGLRLDKDAVARLEAYMQARTG